MIGEQFWTQVIIVLGSVITTYITVKHGPKITDRLRGIPKEAAQDNKFAVWFDGYERTVKFLTHQNEIKDRKITQLEETMDHMQEELDTSRRLVAELREDNAEKQQTIKKLQQSVSQMRKKYDPNWTNGAA